MKKPSLLAAVLLVALTLAVFYPVVHYDFVHWDDDTYVLNNARVQAGLTVENVRWAFTTTYFGYYYPLTWIAHMADCQMFGLHAGGHHAVSLLIHLANVLLLFAALAGMTGAVWRSALVAALFAIHPQHVESVAWISERKDVVSTMFGLIAILAYVRYAEKPSLGRYLAVFSAFMAGLLAKPMIVTLPALFLLLDYWPLARWPSPKDGAARKLLLEKLPLLALVPLFAIVTYAAQSTIHAVASVSAVPIAQRAANALIVTVGYVVKMFAPFRLTAFYAHPRGGISYALALAAGAALAAATLAALRFGREHRYLAVGWLWYLVALAPVCGLIQVGDQASADRYTYLAFVGLFILLVWGAADAFGGALARRPAPAAAFASIVVAALAVRAHDQVHMWKNSTSLFTTMVAIEPSASVAHYNLGKVRDGEGRTEDAVACYEKSIELDPQRAEAWTNLGIDYDKLGRKDDALMAFVRSDAAKPEVAGTQINIGLAHEYLEQWPQAIAAFEKATRLAPENADAWAYLALAYQNAHQSEKAVGAYREAIRLKPELVICRYNLAILALKAGDRAGAQEQADALKPQDAKLAGTLQAVIDGRTPSEAR